MYTYTYVQYVHVYLLDPLLIINDNFNFLLRQWLEKNSNAILQMYIESWR